MGIRTLLLTFLAFLVSFAYAQEAPRGVCGTTEIDLPRLKRNIAAAHAHAAENVGKLNFGRKETTYIPVRFKLFAKDDTTGAASSNNMLDLLAAINVDFAPLDIAFYLQDDGGKPWDVIASSRLYSDSKDETTQLRRLRSDNAITVYVPDDASTPGSAGLGTTLGYYSPSNDFLVFKRTEVDGNASTASHEFGHYFSLPHTFLGWDCTSWEGGTTTDEDNPITSPVDTAIAPCFNNPVELVTRSDSSNCAESGDYFCDTPADYNLGFAYSGCNYTGPVVDANGERLQPDEQNYMGYFIGCNPYHFSDEQAAAMREDYNSFDRNFLRGGSPRNTNPTEEKVTYMEPLEDKAISAFGDILKLEWEPVADADYYLVELSERRSFARSNREVIISANESAYTFANVEPDTRYFYRVRPFSQTSFGALQPGREVTTGTGISSVDDLSQAVSALTLSPNPLQTGQALTLSSNATEGSEVIASIRNLTGQLVSQERLMIAAGLSSSRIEGARTLPRGTYLLSASSPRGTSTRKFIVE